jgi:F420-dependent oxidoreductase-like protein
LDVDIALMVEGQDGLNWERWERLARAAEDLGFAGLYRSDHFTNSSGPHLDSLELWTSLTWLASNSSRIEFGPLVSPVSFRNPVLTAWQAAAVDDLSGGRLWVGMGAGWQEREHDSYGFNLLDVVGRFARFEEGLEVVTRLLQSDEPVDFSGDFFALQHGLLLPRPRRPGGPPIVIGGNGPRRTLPLAARFAREWNAVFATPERFKELSGVLDGLAREAGREPTSIRRTLMQRVTIGRDHAELDRKLVGRDVDDLRSRGAVLGTPDEVRAGLRRFAEAGVERIMAQWIDLDDMDGLEVMAAEVLPHIA